MLRSSTTGGLIEKERETLFPPKHLVAISNNQSGLFAELFVLAEENKQTNFSYYCQLSLNSVCRTAVQTSKCLQPCAYDHHHSDGQITAAMVKFATLFWNEKKKVFFVIF